MPESVVAAAAATDPFEWKTFIVCAITNAAAAAPSSFISSMVGAFYIISSSSRKAASVCSSCACCHVLCYFFTGKIPQNLHVLTLTGKAATQERERKCD